MTCCSRVDERLQDLKASCCPKYTSAASDAETVFLELLRVQNEQKETRGSMFWRDISGTSYLIRESSGGSQKSLGPKNVHTEIIFEKFQLKKEALSQRLKSLTLAVQSQQRMNKALRVGRVPSIVIKTLNALRDAGLQDHFLTIGTHALYAYEAACGVRFMPDALATQDIDLLFDSRKRLSFVSKLKKNGHIFHWRTPKGRSHLSGH